MVKRLLHNQRGSVIVLIAVSLVGMMGMAALAIDLGMLRKTKAEAQRAADAAALGGAAAFLEDMALADKIDSAHSWANQVADTNYMHGEKVDTMSETTITVIPDSVKVRVKVRRAAIGTWFAKIFGINSLPVGAVAAAVASNQGGGEGAACVKPFALPDMWQDSQDGNGGLANRLPDGTETWLWNNGVDTYGIAHLPNEGDGTGLGSDWRNSYPFERDWGRQIVLRPSVSEGTPSQPCPGDLQGNKCYTPGFWGLWGGNTPDMRDKILGCDGTETELETTVPIEGGWRQTLNNSVEIVYNRDPGARWNPTATSPFPNKIGAVENSQFAPGGTTDAGWIKSPRVWIMAMVHPNDIPQVSSDKDTEFNNFMLFFFEGCMDESGTGPIGMPCGTKSMLIGRFIGKAAGGGGGPTTGTMLTHIRLVE